MTDTTYEANGDTVWAINGWLGPDAPEDNQQGDFKLITVCDEIDRPNCNGAMGCREA